MKSPVIQYNDYYAYGLQTGNSWTRDNTKNNFLYKEGTELNPTSCLYDLAYRNFDPVLGRLTQVDPIVDKYASHSTFNYAYNDPITLNDPSGADPYQYTGSAKEYYNSVKNDMFGESWRDRGLVLDAGTKNGGSSSKNWGGGSSAYFSAIQNPGFTSSGTWGLIYAAWSAMAGIANWVGEFIDNGIVFDTPNIVDVGNQRIVSTNIASNDWSVVAGIVVAIQLVPYQEIMDLSILLQGRQEILTQ